MSDQTNTPASTSLYCSRSLRRLILLGLVLAGFVFLPAMQAARPTPTPTPTPSPVPTPDGDLGNGNTAEGSGALFHNVGGVNNTADGFQVLYNNVNGNANTGTGYQVLFSNISGVQNTATGNAALFNNTDGGFNTANGFQALVANTTGGFNTADGYQALATNTTGSQNVALGNFSLISNVTGNHNIGIGYAGGLNLTGDYNIAIGNPGNSGESNTIRIGDANQTATFISGINGAPVVGTTVVIDGNGQLGTLASSKRFKQEIKPMKNASEAIFELNPVTFRYQHEIDPNEKPQFGLVAEEVEKVDPDLVVRDATGKIYSVRYEAVNAMLLNEFLKEHQRVEQLEAAVNELKSNLAKKEQTARKNKRH